MNMLSSARLSGKTVNILGIILAAAIFAVVLPAGLSQDVSILAILPVLLILIAAFALVFTMRAEIATDSENVQIRLQPLYTKRLPPEEILRVAPSTDTAVVQGYGYRVLGNDMRGLLVGGPSIKIETPEKTWVVSCADPDAVSEQLSDIINKR